MHLTMSMFKNTEDYWKARSYLFGQIVAEVVRELGCDRDNEAILMALHELKKDAALGRAVRNFREGMALSRQDSGWAFRQGYSGDIVRRDTPEAALKAAGLMEVAK